MRNSDRIKSRPIRHQALKERRHNVLDNAMTLFQRPVSNEEV